MKTGTLITPIQAKALAIAEALKGAGFVAPNPLVGCVIVDKEHRLLSHGYHAKYGQAHAEVQALNNIEDKKQLAGATLYVTLEPCAHVGKTPSCAHTLKNYPLKKVVYGCSDPNPIATKGADVLREKGIVCEMDLNWQSECRKLAEVFLCNVENKRAFVTLKVATSLDGMMALKNGQSQWITSEAARLHARIQRSHHQATVVGVDTLIADNPLLDYRDTDSRDRINQVVVIDRNLKILNHLKLKIFSTSAQIFLVTSKPIPSPHKNVTVIEANLNSHNHFDLKNLSCRLFTEHKISSLFVEGGSGILSSYLNQRHFDKLELYQGFHLIGGQGRLWSEGFQIGDLRQRCDLAMDSHEVLSSEFHSVWYPK